MARVIITNKVFKKIAKTFNKGEANKVLDLLATLENPHKGKELGHVGNVIIKELKYKKFRFYFVTNRHTLKFLSIDELKDLFVKVVDISEKKDQQKVINQIKHILKNLGEEGFE